MEKNNTEKIKKELEEEKKKLLAEVNEKAKRRNSLMNPDTDYDEPKFKTTTYKKRHFR